MNVSSARASLLLLAILCLSSVFAPAQSKPKPATSSKSASSSAGGGSAAGGSAAGGAAADSSTGPFSIETEMFTYKAVEENSEVIACDIARYLFQGEVVEAPPGSHAPCAISNAAQSNPGIVIVSSDSSLMSDFQLWRADMATMSALEASDVGCREADGRRLIAPWTKFVTTGMPYVTLKKGLSLDGRIAS